MQITDQLIASAANIESCGCSAIPVLAFLRGRALDALQRWPEAELSLLDVEKGIQAQGTLPLQWRLHLLLGQVLRAQGEAEAIQTVFRAIHEGDPDPKLLAYQYLQTLPKLAEGDANKLWIIPSELTEALKGIGEGFFAPRHVAPPTDPGAAPRA